MPDAVEHLELRVGEEGVDPVRPRHGEERVLGGPQHRRGDGQALLGRRGLLGQRGREGAGTRAVPPDARGEGAGARVIVDQGVELMGAGDQPGPLQCSQKWRR